MPGAQPFLDFDVARATFFMVRCDRVDVARRGRERHVDAVLPRVFEQLRLDADNVLDRMAYHARHAHDSQAVLSIAPKAAARSPG